MDSLYDESEGFGVYEEVGKGEEELGDAGEREEEVGVGFVGFCRIL